MPSAAAHMWPNHKHYDHPIDHQEGQYLLRWPVYPLCETELEVLRNWLKDMMASVKIRNSKSLAAAPSLFVHKADSRALRLCMDYIGINTIAIGNRYLLPLMSELQ
jgi:hypothetical protein